MAPNPTERAMAAQPRQAEAKQSDAKQQEPKQGEPRLAEPRHTRVVAASMAAPGHWRAGHYWPAGKAVYADLTEAQLAELRADTRVTIFSGEAPSAQELMAEMAQRAAEQRALEQAALERATRAEREARRR